MPKLDELRGEIQEIDASVIKALAQRQALSKQIGVLKQAEGKDIVDLTQEKILFEYYERLAQEYGLDSGLVRRLFKMIIADSRRVQQL